MLRQIGLTWLGAVLVTLGATLPVQAQDNSAAKVLGQTRESGSLPIWTQAAQSERQRLGQNARDFEPAVFLTGYPQKGHGTSWVVSRKHRLLVTNAHVADIAADAGGKLFAIPSGSSQLYKVENIWYHPGVRRYLNGQHGLSIRSMDPKDGPIDPASPDLAVLQLSADGPELKVELSVASPEELQTLFAQPAAMLGFPGHDTLGWPALGENPGATFHDGVVSRITDFSLSLTAPEEERQFVQYTMSTWGGFSGSPVFLPTGHVAAVHNMARYNKGQAGDVKSIPHGIRIDSLWELLVFHKLDDKLTLPVDREKVRVDRWLKPDERTEKLRQALAEVEQLIQDARQLINFEQDYLTGVKKCNQALEIMPTYAPAYRYRALGFVNYYFKNQRQLGRAESLDALTASLNSAVKYTELAPSDPEGVTLVCLSIVNQGVVTRDFTQHRKALDILNNLLSAENVDRKAKARAHSTRGIAKTGLGDTQGALSDHNEAVRLGPDLVSIWDNRGAFWRSQGRGDLAEADFAKAREIRAAAKK